VSDSHQTQPTVSHRLVLKFPRHLVDSPVIYRLIKDWNLIFNILKANVEPEQEGVLIIQLSGPRDQYKHALAYLKQQGVDVQTLSRDMRFDTAACTSCGVCVPLCPSGALTMDRDSFLVSFNAEKCIACELCARVCPVKAIALRL